MILDIDKTISLIKLSIEYLKINNIKIYTRIITVDTKRKEYYVNIYIITDNELKLVGHGSVPFDKTILGMGGQAKLLAQKILKSVFCQQKILPNLMWEEI